MPLLNVHDWSWRVYERFFYTAIKGIKLEGRGFDWFVERKKTLSRPHAFFENKWTRNQLMNFFSKLKFLPLSTKEKPTHTVEKLLGRSFFTHFSGNLWLISEHIIDIPEDGLVFSKPSNRQVNLKKNRDLRMYWPGRPCYYIAEANSQTSQNICSIQM